MYRILSACLVVLACLCSLPVRAAGEPLPAWQLRAPGLEVTLLGSIHMAYPDTYPLRSPIEAAFDDAATLVVEVDTLSLDPLVTEQLVATRGRLPEGQTLDQVLEPATWAELSAYLGERGVPPEAIAALKPGMVVTVLSVIALQELGLRPDLGIDIHFIRQAAREGKSVVELESFEQQLDMLLGFPQSDLLLQQTLEEVADMKAAMDPLYQAWLNGDAVSLERLLISESLAEHPEFEPVYEPLFFERNREMTENLQQLFNSGGKYFVVVGAGHLVGEQGIISLLQERGFELRPLATTPKQQEEQDGERNEVAGNGNGGVLRAGG